MCANVFLIQYKFIMNIIILSFLPLTIDSQFALCGIYIKCVCVYIRLFDLRFLNHGSYRALDRDMRLTSQIEKQDMLLPNTLLL